MADDWEKKKKGKKFSWKNLYVTVREIERTNGSRHALDVYYQNKQTNYFLIDRSIDRSIDISNESNNNNNNILGKLTIKFF